MTKYPDNRIGVCALCGDKLGFYDSKWIEMNGERLICVYNRKGISALSRCDLQINTEEFWYYTDG